jgi:hypothetical protein
VRRVLNQSRIGIKINHLFLPSFVIKLLIPTNEAQRGTFT